MSEWAEHPSGLLVPPKFGTARDLAYPTIGGRQGAFARTWLGKPFLPWQQYVADVTGEFDPVTGLPRYTLCVITLQRQGGKSHLAMAQTGERCFSRPKFRAWYTAQTGQDARDQFLKFQDDVVEGTALDEVVTTLRGNGHEEMRFPNMSKIRPHPPTEKALHGKQSDRNDIDEGWAFSEDEGKALLQATSPTKLTRPGAQTFIWSAGGTAASTWLAALVARGRGGDPTMAYFEWGIPDDLPLDDLDAIARYHPAYGHTITGAALAGLRAELPDDAEFARAAGNRWTEVIGGAIRSGDWLTVRYGDAIPDDAPVGYGAARAEDGSHVVIAAAAELPDGRHVVEVLDVVPAWGAAETVRAWAAGAALAVSPSGPHAALHADLDQLGVPMLPLNARDESAATTRVIDAIPARAYLFRRHPALDAAVKVAGTRTVGDGGRAWARVSAGAPIAAVEAATMALWAVTHRPIVTGKPKSRFGGRAA